MSPGVSQVRGWVLVALCCVSPAYGQSGPSAAVPFTGCYEVVSLAWSPPDETIRLIPKRFKLLVGAPFRGYNVLRIQPIPNDGFPRVWWWKPKGKRLWVSWGTGFGGFRGTVKPSDNGELVGKLKEWCDARCGWKKRVGKIRIRRIDCPE